MDNHPVGRRLRQHDGSVSRYPIGQRDSTGTEPVAARRGMDSSWTPRQTRNNERTGGLEELGGGGGARRPHAHRGATIQVRRLGSATSHRPDIHVMQHSAPSLRKKIAAHSSRGHGGGSSCRRSPRVAHESHPRGSPPILANEPRRPDLHQNSRISRSGATGSSFCMSSTNPIMWIGLHCGG